MTARDVQTNIRLPEDLKARLIEAARANQRSMGAEIVARLQASFEQTPVAPSIQEVINYTAKQTVDAMVAAGWRLGKPKGE